VPDGRQILFKFDGWERPLGVAFDTGSLSTWLEATARTAAALAKRIREAEQDGGTIELSREERMALLGTELRRADTSRQDGLQALQSVLLQEEQLDPKNRSGFPPVDPYEDDWVGPQVPQRTG
jgi:hypothetical protein